MKPSAKANKIRHAIRDLAFKHSVRAWQDGEIWVMAEYGTEARCAQIIAALEREGFSTRRSGKPGTAGQYIVEIVGERK